MIDDISFLLLGVCRQYSIFNTHSCANGSSNACGRGRGIHGEGNVIYVVGM